MNQNKMGFILNGDNPGQEQIKLFKSRRCAKKFLREKAPELRHGWGHYIIPVYVKKVSG